jgi:histidinol-phosphate aminotransferase
MAISRRTLLERFGAGALSAVGARHIAFGADLRLDGVPVDGVIRLHRNENVYGPSRKALEAMREAAAHSARYPDAAAASLRRTIADAHRVGSDRIVLGCGSTEILQMAIHAFAGRNKTILTARPTFETIAVLARRAGARIVDVPLNRDYSHDLEGMLARVDARTGLVYICNPHNPTGSLTRRAAVDAFLQKLPARVHVVIDEAYHEFVGHAADYRSLIDRIDDGRVVVTRSFSKVHGLAGLRIGYAVAAAATADSLRSHAASDDIHIVAARAAAAALDDHDHVRLCVDRTADERQEFLNQANARMLRSIDSLTNFIMLDTGRPSTEVVEHFAKHRVLVSGKLSGFDRHIRISIGTPSEMREFWRVWDLMPGGHLMHM